MLASVTTGFPTGRRRGRRRGRTLRTLLILVAVATVPAVVALGVVVVPWLREPGPRPLFQLPVACGETWQLGTYPGHDDYDVDLFPTEGDPWGRPVLASYDGVVTVAGVNGSVGVETCDEVLHGPLQGGDPLGQLRLSHHPTIT